MQTGELGRAAELIQLGLRSRERPAQHADYRALVHRYLEVSEFREMVREVARGLGLLVLAVSEHGVVLGPAEGSVFALPPREFRKTLTADDRLLDGLVQLSIATTLFPRARDLEEEATYARPPVTVAEIEATLRGLCQRLEEAAKQRGEPDPTVSNDEAGLYEAWRAYHRRQPAAQTKDGRKAAGTTLRIIEDNLERLCEFGCFLRNTRAGRIEYQATWRYQVLVKDLASTALYQRVRTLVDRPEAS